MVLLGIFTVTIVELGVYLLHLFLKIHVLEAMNGTKCAPLQCRRALCSTGANMWGVWEKHEKNEVVSLAPSFFGGPRDFSCLGSIIFFFSVNSIGIFIT
jgi:hypothetical protein